MMNKGKERATHQQPASPDMDVGVGVNQIQPFDLYQNDEIFSDEQKKNIIKMFPESIQHFLKTIKNPLDEKEVLINIFKNKNVRIIIIYEQDILGDMDWIPYFHCPDIAKISKYPEDHVSRWNSTWKLKLITYKNLLAKIGEYQKLLLKIEEQQKSLPKIGEHIKINFEDKQTNINSFFINYNDLKEVLIRINTDESHEYKNWLLRQSTIMSKFLKYLHEIKNKQEIEQKIYEIEKKDKLIKQIEETNQRKIEEYEDKVKLIEEAKEKERKEYAERLRNAYKYYPDKHSIKGKIYISSSTHFQKNCIYRVGNTIDTNKRESNGQTTDFTYKILYEREVKDKLSYEKAIHYILNPTRKFANKEFFYFTSLEYAIDEVNKIIDFIDNMEGNMEKIRELYVYGEIENIYIMEEEEIDKMENNNMSNNDNLILNQIEKIEEIQKDCENDDYKKFVEEQITKQQKIKNIYKKFKEWCLEKEITNIPNEEKLMINLKEHNCEIIKINDIEYIMKKKQNMKDSMLYWIKNHYIKTENITDVITIKEMYRDYKESEFYSNLSKADKRKNNENDFREKISENIFLKKYYFKQKTINGIKYNNAITNYKKKEQDYDEF